MSLELLVVYGISHFFLITCLMIFIKRRYNWYITTAMMAVEYLLILMLEIGCYVMFLNGYNWRLNMVISFGIALAWVLILSDYRDSRALFSALMAGSYSMFGSLAGKILLSVGVNVVVAVPVSIAVHVLVLAVLIRFLLPPYRKRQCIYREEWRLLTLVLVMFYGGMYLLYDCLKQPDMTFLHNLVPLVYLFTVCLLVTLVFQMLDRLNEREMAEREQKVLQAGMGALKIEVDELRRAERRIAEYNHDSRHFTRMLRGMMAEQDYPGVVQALAQMQSAPEVTYTKRYCANTPLNGVVSYYVRMAREHLVEIVVELEALPERVGENGWELAAVIGNLLENAVQASIMAEPEENRQLHIRGRKSSGQMLFEIRNTYSGTIEFDKATGLPVSDRGEGHGLGMRSVANFVKQWHGTLDCGVEGDWFYVRMLI